MGHMKGVISKYEIVSNLKLPYKRHALLRIIKRCILYLFYRKQKEIESFFFKTFAYVTNIETPAE